MNNEIQFDSQNEFVNIQNDNDEETEQIILLDSPKIKRLMRETSFRKKHNVSESMTEDGKNYIFFVNL